MWLCRWTTKKSIEVSAHSSGECWYGQQVRAASNTGPWQKDHGIHEQGKILSWVGCHTPHFFPGMLLHLKGHHLRSLVARRGVWVPHTHISGSHWSGKVTEGKRQRWGGGEHGEWEWKACALGGCAPQSTVLWKCSLVLLPFDFSRRYFF